MATGNSTRPPSSPSRCSTTSSTVRVCVRVRATFSTTASRSRNQSAVLETKAQLPNALHVPDTWVVDSGLPREGAYESVRLPSQDTLVVGDGIVGARLTLGASSFGYGGGEDLRHPGHQNLLDGFMGCVGAGQPTLFTEIYSPSCEKGSSRKPSFRHTQFSETGLPLTKLRENQVNDPDSSLLLAHYQDRAVSVANHRITNASHEGAPYPAPSTTSYHY